MCNNQLLDNVCGLDTICALYGQDMWVATCRCCLHVGDEIFPKLRAAKKLAICGAQSVYCM